MSTRQREKAIERRAERKAQGPSATLRWLRISPRKVRLVVDMIRGRDVEGAFKILGFCDKAAAKPVIKLLQSAAANAAQRGVDGIDGLVVESAFVNEGPTWRRWLPRAMGRATRVRKRTSHVTIILSELAS